MTMRTRRYFVCANEHEGVEITTESDQPNSRRAERVSLVNLVHAGADARGSAHYVCEQCLAPMKLKA